MKEHATAFGEHGALVALRAKLSPPAASGWEMRRQRLLDAVHAQGNAKLIVLRAPAGFGKTTAMAQIRLDLEQSAVRTTWLTLDAADNDPPRFLHALHRCIDRLTDVAVDSPRTAGHDVPVAYRLASCEGPFALFLDEFEAVQESRVLEWVRELIAALPAHGRVIIGSRVLPDLRLARLRAQGQLVEIDSDQLRFSEGETKELLCARQKRPLSPDLLTELHHKTEGWATGLRLAALAIDQQPSTADFVHRFSGSSLSVADYLLGEVLNQQQPQARSFLLRTSILRVLTPELCHVLVPDLDAGAMLLELGARNVLISPVEAERPTYRYHSLFADFLQSELKREAPELLEPLHAAAAGWFEAQGRPVPAIEHFLQSGQLRQVLPLIERHGPALLAQGRLRLLARWFVKIPHSVLVDVPSIRLVQLWTMCLTTGPWEAMRELEASGLADSTDPYVQGQVAAIRPAMYSMMDKLEEAARVGRESLARLPSASKWADDALINTMSGVFCQLGDSAQTIELINASRHAQGAGHGQLHQMYAEVTEGTLDLVDGRIYEAHARFGTALAASRVSHPAGSDGNAYAALFYALTLYERNQIAQATELLRAHLPLARGIGLPDHMIGGYRMLARIASQAGEIDEAFRVLTELELLGHERHLPRVTMSARLERSRLQLLQGKHQAAHQELSRALSCGTSERTRDQRLTSNEVDYEVLAQLRWEAVAGNADAAAVGLSTELSAAMSARRRRRAMALRLVRSMALGRAGQEIPARIALEEVLRECHSNGVVRMVLDEGPVLGVLVRQLHARAASPSTVLADARFVGYLAELIEAYGSTLPPVEKEAAERAVLLDPLTEKEIHVLHLLADGYSNVAMAEKLGISDSTIRTHLRNINSKLAVNSRMQAVVAARRLGVLR